MDQGTISTDTRAYNLGHILQSRDLGIPGLEEAYTYSLGESSKKKY